MSNCINQSLQGFYKVQIVNPETKEVVWEQPEWQKNLILNNGMDHIYSDTIVNQMTYAMAGDGTRPNQKSSGTSTVTQSANTVYLYNRAGDIADFTSSFAGAYPALVEAGDILKYANNSESKVSAVDAGGFMLTVTPSLTFGAGDAQQFTVWKTSQTALQNEIIARSATYVTATGYCGTTTVGNTKTHRRSYDFPVQGAPGGYNELGVGWNAAGAGTTFSRILLPSTIIVATGFQLRMIYDLQTTFTPYVSQSKSIAVGGGWGILNGSESIQTFLSSEIDTNGTSVNDYAVLDPSWLNTGNNYLSVYISSISSSLAAFGSAVNRQSADVGYSTTAFSKTGQVLGTYQVDKTGIIGVTTGNSTFLRSVGLGRYNSGLGYNPAASAHQGSCYVFDTNQTKTSVQTISFTFRWTWARVLS